MTVTELLNKMIEEINKAIENKDYDGVHTLSSAYQRIFSVTYPN